MEQYRHKSKVVMHREMESVSSDLMELEGILGLYNWVQNYDYSKVPTRRSLFLEIKSRLHLKIVNKSNALTPRTSGTLRSENSKVSNKHAENLSEKRCPPQKVQECRVGVGSGLFGTSIERRSRPSTLCSIYPISAFSRIHETILDASYKNSRICDYNSSSDGDESCEEYKYYLTGHGSTSMLQEARGKGLEGNPGKKAAEDDNNSAASSSAEHDEEDEDGKYLCEMDVSSLNDLITYLKKMIRLRSIAGQGTNVSGDYLRRGKNFCFLTLWKKVEELMQKKVGDLNEEISVWQQLRDVLLLTGMSLKYPTWSGEQLTIIMTSIIPKKLLNAIVETNRDKLPNNDYKNRIRNGGGGLSEIYFRFIENSKTVFDLLTVSQLIQESLSKHLDWIKSLNSGKEVAGSKLGDDMLSSEENFLEATSEYSACEDYGLDEDGYVSVLEVESNEFSGSNKVVESKLIDSLGLFVNLSDVRRPLTDDYGSSRVSSNVSFYYRANMENSNTTIITSTTTATAAAANTNDKRNGEPKPTSSSGNATNGHIAELEFDIHNSFQRIGESVINLGISRKFLQDLINEELIRGASSSSILIEREALVNVCRLVDNCIYHSNSILGKCHKSKAPRGKHSSRRAIIWLFTSVIITMLILLVGRHSNHPAVIQLMEGTWSTLSDQLTFERIAPPSVSLSSAFHDGDDSHSEVYKNFIKASDCILSKSANQAGVNSDLCSVIGDVTVIEKCFTNINISY